MRRMMGVFLLMVVTSGWAGADPGVFEAASQAAAAGDYETVLNHYEAALRADPNNLGYGNAYRQVAVKLNAMKTYNRCIAFFQQLTIDHPDAPNAWMNFGYAHVDKIPVEGAITQVLLANTALGHFSKALALEETWLGHYTRGNSYLYWPAIFGRTPLAVADLEKAIALSEKEKKRRPHHVRPYLGLGEAHWRLNDVKKAREIWADALKKFPKNEDLKTRLSLDDEALTAFLTTHFEPGKRVDTNLSVLWEKE